jgi:AraC family transcriptional activator of pobA
MANTNNKIHSFQSLSEVHQMLGLPKPKHPLISIINNAIAVSLKDAPNAFILNLYKITYKPNLKGKIKYGQQYCDFDEGGMFFLLPDHVTADYDKAADYSGYTILIHPDFLLSYPLGIKIKQYGFFSYSANEALHLSDIEKNTVISIFNLVEKELNSRIDESSQEVIIAQIELLLSYAQRFYRRQFITRKVINNDVLQKLEVYSTHYFNSEKLLKDGIPSVQSLADQVYVSPGYLSDMLRSLTGQNTQQYIQNKLIEKAKEMLATSNLSIGDVAMRLGFEHPQSFNKLFKLKTKLTPLEFRKTYN